MRCQSLLLSCGRDVLPSPRWNVVVSSCPQDRSTAQLQDRGACRASVHPQGTPTSRGPISERPLPAEGPGNETSLHRSTPCPGVSSRLLQSFKRWLNEEKLMCASVRCECSSFTTYSRCGPFDELSTWSRHPSLCGAPPWDVRFGSRSWTVFLSLLQSLFSSFPHELNSDLPQELQRGCHGPGGDAEAPRSSCCSWLKG